MIKKILLAVTALLTSIYIGFWATAPLSVDPAQYQILADKYDVHIVRDKYAHHIYQQVFDIWFSLWMCGMWWTLAMRAA